MIQSEFVGLKQANAALRRLPEFVRIDAQQEMDTTAFQVSQIAKSGVHSVTGRLVKAIQWRSRPRTISAVVGILFEAFYWKFVERGTKKMSARPFLRPAADRMRGDHQRRVIIAMERSSKKMAALAK